MKTQVKNYFLIKQFFIIDRHRRSKHEQEGRIFACDCGKAFLSKPALNNHIKTKHPETFEGQIKRGRGDLGNIHQKVDLGNIHQNPYLFSKVQNMIIFSTHRKEKLKMAKKLIFQF